MRVRVRLFAAFREATGRKEIDFSLEAPASPEILLAQLVAEYPDLRPIASVSRFVVNQEYVPGDTPLRDGDEVAFLPPVSGGDVFEVTSEPLGDAGSATAVCNECVGAVVTFVGVVRGFSRGKPVRYLEYEAFPEMAERQLAEIGATLREKWGVESVTIRHRVGHLIVGEVAIVIAVGAAHRAEAFAACGYAVDQIKKVVPVWKKEVWEDGEVWVGMEGA